MAHTTQAAHGHMQDYEGHVQAVEADLEYWRTKRLEPRVIQLHRRGVVTLYDLLRAAAHGAASAATGEATHKATHEIEGRIRALEDGLDEYIRGIALASIDSPDHPFVIEDTRRNAATTTTSSASPSRPTTARWMSASRGWSTIFASTSACCKCSCARCSTRAC
jgi:cell division protein FtsB